MNCLHNWKVNWYRVVWSGKFTLLSEICKDCDLVRERSIENFTMQKPTDWIKA